MSSRWPASRLLLAVTVAALTATAALTGCKPRGGTFEDSATEPVRITEIRIDGGKGNVIVQPGDRNKVEIHRKVTFRGERPEGRSHAIEGSVLRLRTTCEKRTCDISYDVRAPRGVRIAGENQTGDLRVTGVSTVTFKLESGDIAIRDASAAVDVRTDSGEIELVDARGPATLRARSGDVRALGVRGPALTAETSSGHLQLELTKAADVRAKTSNGDIRLVVPPDDYQVHATARSGKVDVRIATNPEGRRKLNVETRDGDIVVDPR
ncbi:MAG: DUF4097 family beta strand repeat-containing protein [Micromonosporaceae bacterium]